MIDLTVISQTEERYAERKAVRDATVRKIETKPLLEVYGARGVVIKVDGMGEVDEVTARIDAALPS